MSAHAPFAVLRADLESARRTHGALSLAIDDGDDYGEHVGLQRHRRAVYDGQAEILKLWQESLDRVQSGDTEPPPLPARIYGPESASGRSVKP